MVRAFRERQPGVSKRQVQLKIKEIAEWDQKRMLWVLKTPRAAGLEPKVCFT